MNRRNVIKIMSRTVLGAGATSLLPNCATSGGMAGGGGALPPATKDNPFVNSLGMKFVPVPGTKILMCTTETTVSQYQAMGKGYRYPRFSQTGSHPAMNVSWDDAKAWCKWLSQKEGRSYRLPTDAEWSAAVGGSTYPWGNQWPPPNKAGNYAGQEWRDCTPAEREMLSGGFQSFDIIGGFSDRHRISTAPVGSYSPNRLGIYDLGGNVWEWCEDRHPITRDFRILRGASWCVSDRATMQSSFRFCASPESRELHGFRCVLG